MFEYKKLPKAIPLTEDNTVFAVGWVKNNSFVVESYLKGKTIKEKLGLEEDPDRPKGELLSLWDWGIKNEITLKEFNEIQKNLETYIEIEE